LGKRLENVCEKTFNKRLEIMFSKRLQNVAKRLHASKRFLN